MGYFTIYCYIKEVRTFVLLNITKSKITLTIVAMPLFDISVHTKAPNFPAIIVIVGANLLFI